MSKKKGHLSIALHNYVFSVLNRVYSAFAIGKGGLNRKRRRNDNENEKHKRELIFKEYGQGMFVCYGIARWGGGNVCKDLVCVFRVCPGDENARERATGGLLL